MSHIRDNSTLVTAQREDGPHLKPNSRIGPQPPLIGKRVSENVLDTSVAATIASMSSSSSSSTASSASTQSVTSSTSNTKDQQAQPPKFVKAHSNSSLYSVTSSPVLPTTTNAATSASVATPSTATTQGLHSMAPSSSSTTGSGPVNPSIASTMAAEISTKSPPVSPRGSMVLMNNSFLSFGNWGKQNGLKDKEKDKNKANNKRTQIRYEKQIKPAEEDQVEGVPWGLPKAVKYKTPPELGGTFSVTNNKRRASERPEVSVKPNSHCHVIVGDQWKKLRNAVDNPKFDHPLLSDEESLAYNGSVSLSNHISLFVHERTSFRAQGGGEIKLAFNTDYEIHWVQKDTEFEEGHILLIAFSINLLKYFAQNEPFHLVYALGAKKKFDFKKTCRIFGRAFKLLLQKNNLRAVKKAFSSTIPVTYDNPIVAEAADELPRIKVLNLNWRHPYVLLSKQGVGLLKGVEMPVPKLILTAPNLEELMVRSSYYQRLLSEKVNSDPKVVYGKSISTYPSNPSTNLICDTYLAKVYDNFAVMVIADGCNWGIYAAMAAQFATLGFTRHVEEHLLNQSKRSSQAVGEILLAALQAAHKNIMDSHRQYLKSKNLPPEIPAGTTTLLGGVILPVQHEEAEFVLITASVGDCKCYRISSSGKVTDLTKGTRSSPDPCDPGGRLGPYIEDKNPDLRNMGLCMALLQPGDIVAMVSDGVHDNFDPKMTGDNPEDWGLSSYAEYDIRPSLIDVHKERKAEEVITKESFATAEDVVENIINYSWKTTESSRVWMEENPRLKLPVDYQQFPGKMDHSTCLAFRMFKSENTAVRRNSIISEINPPSFISFDDKLIYEQPVKSQILDVRTTERNNLNQQLAEKNQLIATQKEQIRIMEQTLKEHNIDISHLLKAITNPPSNLPEAPSPIAERRTVQPTDMGSVDFRKNVDILVELMENSSSSSTEDSVD
eukprot:TRINITY_DN10817_c0_g1_i3.p1 TRINITY_DN10817_c0_g1~~TRINITY_DN10817_c0_g1_i3.p1  ORF type:complete len:947 (-),score=208.52 TRINITY_DN10817_c0_g1_i3:107-2947(-)